MHRYNPIRSDGSLDVWCVKFNAWQHEHAKSLDVAIVAQLAKEVESHYGTEYSDALVRAELWMLSLIAVAIFLFAYFVIKGQVEALLNSSLDDALAAIQKTAAVVSLLLSVGGLLVVTWRCCTPVGTVSDEIKMLHTRWHCFR